MTDSYDDCSDMGFYSTLDADAGDNAGEGFDDGDAVGITDDTTLFGGAADGDQWFQASDTDGVLRMYVDHATGVSAVSMWLAIASTDWEEEDYYASYWVGDDGVTTELGNSHELVGRHRQLLVRGILGPVGRGSALRGRLPDARGEQRRRRRALGTGQRRIPRQQLGRHLDDHLRGLGRGDGDVHDPILALAPAGLVHSDRSTTRTATAVTESP